jgi:hypothetical protein
VLTNLSIVQQFFEICDAIGKARVAPSVPHFEARYIEASSFGKEKQGYFELTQYFLNLVQQKLVIGDDSGTLSCFEFNKGEPQIVFQMKVFENGGISSIAIGGNHLKPDKVEQIIHNI